MPEPASWNRPLFMIGAALLMAAALSSQSTGPAKPAAKAAAPEEAGGRDEYATGWQRVHEQNARRLERVDFEALRRAIGDLDSSFRDRYAGQEFLRRIELAEKRRPAILAALKKRQPAALDEAQAVFDLQRDAMLSNPLLDFDRLLVVKRKPLGDPRMPESQSYGLGEFLGLPRQSSWQIHAIPQVFGWENEVAVLSSLRHGAQLQTLFRPPSRRLVSDVDLNWDADRMLVSMPDDKGVWQVWEISADGKGLRRLSPGGQPDVHSYDAVYLPGGKINFISTAALQGVPCNAGLTVGMMYQMDADGRNIRQLSFDQDHNYNPTVMNDGRILYLRWEYTDIPHVWARYLFTMNPDGTDQRAYYKSGSYWPNSTFYTRPVPGHPSKVAGVITGHHVGRVGELMVFDPARARTGAEGVVQQIPGYGKKVSPLIQDKLTINVFPKFLHPYPLSEKYFLVAAKPAPESLWGIYLVDVFDNMTLIREEEGYALLEPVPFRKTPRPPVIPDRVNLARNDAVAYVSDVYSGPGLKGVPRGAVKSLRLYTYHFGYSNLAGIHNRVGADGPWEPKQVLGTVPVEKDGSAYFRVPARTPISIQPLDEKGRAVQLMRSWLTAMPGEFVSCNGCHESQSLAAVNRDTIAIRREVSEIRPWRGEPRGFDFSREVQPVLDRHCVGCHNGTPRRDGRTLANLRGNQGKLVAYKNGDPVAKFIPSPATESDHRKYGGIFEPSYIELRRYVRASGLESDLRGIPAGEFHANTTHLVQMLEAGHHGVKLDEESWDRLNTWIDLNTPAHGTWRETVGCERVDKLALRRAELQQMYAGFQRPDPEAVPVARPAPVEPIVPKMLPVAAGSAKAALWPFTADEAQRRQSALGGTTRTLDLGDGVRMEMVLVPAGEFVMGDGAGYANERPLAPVRIDKPFWIGRFEVTNEQWAKFDASHDSRYEHKGSWKFNEWDLGWPLNGPRQPVVRVSQKEALAFVGWLAERSGLKVALPTEAQWEYACRAGSAAPFSYGAADSDFSKFANLADYTIRDLVYDVRDQYPPDLVPREARFNDGKLVTADAGTYLPNAWGLHDMHGNAWEWTQTALRPYPYAERDGRNTPGEGEFVVARGGSWYDHPLRARAGFRLGFPAWQKVYNVGLRVVAEAEPEKPLLAAKDTAGRKLQ